MHLFDPIPRPRIGRPVPHRFVLPVRLMGGIPPTVLSRRREREAREGGFGSPLEAAVARVNEIAETIRQRLLNLRHRRWFPGFPGFQGFGKTWSDEP